MRYLKFSVFNFFILIIAANISAQQKEACYQHFKEAENVYRIVENKTVNIYLVEGKDSALVIDTGYGTGDLLEYIKTLTNLPLIVLNTHGHGDHCLGNGQFLKIYAHTKDFQMIENSLESKGISKLPELISVKEGYVFNLGGRKLEVIEVPGHTSGSICLLDSENKILFAGDNTNKIVWLFLKECLPLEVYLKSLEKVEKHINDYDIIMPGHNEPLAKDFIYEQITCVKNILEGKCQAVPYNYSPMTAGSMLCKFKSSEVAYDPENLFLKK